jgi:hypothetical protein
MPRFVANIFIICCALVISGCASVQPISPNTLPVTLDQSYTRKIENYGMGIVFPAGIYRANFQTEQGIYYLSPTFIIMNGHPIDTQSGLFVPKSPNEKQALWMGGAFENPTHRYTLDEAVPYH